MTNNGLTPSQLDKKEATSIVNSDLDEHDKTIIKILEDRGPCSTQLISRQGGYVGQKHHVRYRLDETRGRLREAGLVKKVGEEDIAGVPLPANVYDLTPKAEVAIQHGLLMDEENDTTEVVYDEKTVDQMHHDIQSLEERVKILEEENQKLQEGMNTLWEAVFNVDLDEGESG